MNMVFILWQFKYLHQTIAISSCLEYHSTVICSVLNHIIMLPIHSPNNATCSFLCGVLSQGAAANPDSEEQQQKLREAAEGLRMATNAAAQNAIKKRLVNKLEVTSHLHSWNMFKSGISFIHLLFIPLVPIIS